MAAIKTENKDALATLIFDNRGKLNDPIDEV